MPWADSEEDILLDHRVGIPQKNPIASLRSAFAGVKGLWAVRFRPEGLPWEPDFAFHAFLLLTVGRKTIVLQTGEELSEMQGAQVDFVLEKPTLLAANLFSWARTVQVGASFDLTRYTVEIH